ncbi:MAG: hypothetical protein WBF06_13025 [Candidatus Acidiferrales bacterium]
MKVHEFEKIVNKLGLKVRNSGDRLAWFEYGGQTVVRTKRSQGNKEQPGNLIRQQLKLNEKQLAGLIRCDVSLDDYIEILKNKKIIAVESQSSSPQSRSTQKPTKS